MNAFKLVFSAKTCFKVVFRSVKIGKAHSFPCRSLLLSTTIFNNDTTMASATLTMASVNENFDKTINKQLQTFVNINNIFI